MENLTVIKLNDADNVARSSINLMSDDDVSMKNSIISITSDDDVSMKSSIILITSDDDYSMKSSIISITKETDFVMEGSTVVISSDVENAVEGMLMLYPPEEENVLEDLQVLEPNGDEIVLEDVPGLKLYGDEDDLDDLLIEVKHEPSEHLDLDGTTAPNSPEDDPLSDDGGTEYTLAGFVASEPSEDEAAIVDYAAHCYNAGARYVPRPCFCCTTRRNLKSKNCVDTKCPADGLGVTIKRCVGAKVLSGDMVYRKNRGSRQTIGIANRHKPRIKNRMKVKKV